MQQNSFTEGQNKDVDVRYLKPTQFRNALNIRITDSVEGSLFSITNVKGNRQLDYTLPEGKNVVIGSKEDVTSQNLFVFIYNDRNDHRILKVNYVTEEVVTLIEGIGIRFEEDKKIKDIEFIGRRYLDWVQEGKEMGSVDITETYPNIIDNNRYLIEKAKSPHQAIITAEYDSDENFKDNNLRGSVWQFSVVYVYEDNTRSNVSSRSVIAVPSSDNIVQYGGNVPSTQDNLILVTVNTGLDTIKKVELLARRVQIGTVGEWFIADSIEKDELTPETLTLEFRNNKFERFADITETNQVGSFFPKNPISLVYGYDKREFLGNFTDGWEQVSVNGELDWIYNDIPEDTSTLAGTAGNNSTDNSESQRIPTAGATSDFVARYARYDNVFNEIDISGNPSGAQLGVDMISRPISFSGTPTLGDTITIELELRNLRYFEQGGNLVPVDPFTSDYSYQTSITLVQEDLEQNSVGQYQKLLEKVCDKINADNTSSSNNIGGVVAQPASPTVNDNRIFLYQAIKNKVNTFRSFAITQIKSATVTVEASEFAIPPQINFKRGVEHQFGLAYEDNKGRLSTVYTTDDWKSSPLISTNVNPSPFRGSVNVKLSFEHKAPESATYYHVVHRVVKSRYIQFIGELEDLGTNNYSISLSDLTDYNTEYESSILGYDFVKGDKIRILRTQSGTLVTPDPPEGVLDEVEIERYDTTENKVFFSFNPTTSPVLTGGIKYLFEIRGASPENNNNTFFETGISYPVDNSQFHRSGNNLNDQNQNSNQSCILNVLSYGDSYFRNRVFDVTSGTELFIEDDSVSDFYEASPYGIGRPNIVDNNARVVNREASVVFTEPFAGEDTFVNGTATVYDVSFKDYTEQYGGIQKIYSDGRRLKCFLERKVGFVGVNQANTIEAAGGVKYDTSQVLTEMDFYDWELGIGNSGESFIEDKGVEYWVDEFRGSVCKFTQSGLQELQMRGLSGELTATIQDTQGNPYKFIKPFINKQYGELGIIIGNDESVSENDFGSIIVDNENFLRFTVPSTFFKNLSVGDKVTTYQTELGGGAPTYFTDESTVSIKSELSGVFTIQIDYSTPRPPAREGFNWFVSQIYFENRQLFIYQEDINAWVGKRSNKYEWADFKNINYVTYKNGQLWVEESNDTRNNFYGIPYNSQVEIYVNENPRYSKRLLVLEEQSTTAWEAEIETSTSSGDNNNSFQESNLITQDFQKKLNFWQAGFWRDINTPNVSSPLINGDALRGDHAKIVLTNSSSEKEELFAVGTKYEIDRLSSDE